MNHFEESSYYSKDLRNWNILFYLNNSPKLSFKVCHLIAAVKADSHPSLLLYLTLSLHSTSFTLLFRHTSVHLQENRGPCFNYIMVCLFIPYYCSVQLLHLPIDVNHLRM